jgi:hypothetical protein
VYLQRYNYPELWAKKNNKAETSARPHTQEAITIFTYQIDSHKKKFTVWSNCTETGKPEARTWPNETMSPFAESNTESSSTLEMVQKYWICYLVTGIFKQFHGTDIGCVR